MALTALRTCRLAAGILLLAGFALPARAAAPTPEDARRAYDAKRFKDAMGIWAELSRQGNVEAAFGIGLLYDLGNGTPENAGAAFYWYKIAAEAGFPAAEFNVAAMYDSGRGAAKDMPSAALWYARAAARGHHRAQFDLGQLYEQGEGVPRNIEAAEAWFRDAADGGITAAESRLKALQGTPQHRPDAKLTAVTPAFPVRNVTLKPIVGDPTVELVWVAPPEPQPVHYEVQVRELGGPTLRVVFDAALTETAALVHVPSKPGFYVWNVDVVGRDGTHAAGDWSWFSIDPAASPRQSMAAAPEASH